MDYYINPQSLSYVFTVPSAVVDRCFKLAKAEHIKILLYMLKNMSENLTEEEVAAACGVSEFDVKEALLFWESENIVLKKDQPVTILPAGAGEKTVIRKREKPSRSDVAKRGLEDPKIQYLLREAQVKLCRNLKDNEARTLVWLYDDEGLDVSVILLIIQYAVTRNKANIRFIESVAVSMIEKGIDSAPDADAELHKMDIGEQAWRVVSKAFGIENRKPSAKETENSVKWVCEWHITTDMLNAAYDECVDQKSKFSFAYVSKIIENWHSKGYKTPEDAAKKQKDKKQTEDFVSYDIDLYEKMLNSKE